jgi:hypothetical protein
MRVPFAIVYERGPITFPISGLSFGPTQFVMENRRNDTAIQMVARCRRLGFKPLFIINLKRIKKG